MSAISYHPTEVNLADRADNPILIVPYLWIGDFVRVHSVVRLLKHRWPNRPIDLLTSSLCAPILDYLPGVRTGIVADLPRRRLPLSQYSALGKQLARQHYGTALIMPRTWKAALAPFLAGIPERTGFAGEFRFLLVNDMRFGERRLERMIDCFVGPVPCRKTQLCRQRLTRYQRNRGPGRRAGKMVVAQWLAPSPAGRSWRWRRARSGPGKAWPVQNYAELARQLAEQGADVWVLGGPAEKAIAAQIAAAGGPSVSRSHGKRPAQRDRSAGRGRPRRHQRFRPDAHLGGHWDADRGDLRPDICRVCGPRSTLCRRSSSRRARSPTSRTAAPPA
jgi:heptosyltransferase-2